MDEVRKWKVTYTKHVKQKRKVYQEGFLELLNNNNNNKVLLFDESHNLLDSKFLNKGAAVNPGDSLPFSSFLVHIGDPETTSASILLPSPNSVSHHQKPTSSTRKTSANINSLSPSHKIIRAFKKNEVIKYSTHHTPSNLTTSSPKEWEALYTTQVTQKAKKYHDGFIQLIICGSQSRQVALYDSSKTQIDKRFLKKDEVICSGESLKFDGHLVDIGDALANTSNDADVKNEARNYNSDQVMGDRKRHKLSTGNLVFNPQRCKEPTGRNHLRAGNAVQIDVSRNYAGSSISHDSSFGGLRIDKMNPTKIPSSPMPPRDVHHILSILKKPAAQDNVPILEEATGKQCLTQYSEVVQAVIDGKPSAGIAQSDHHQATKVTNEYDCDEAATAQPNTDCSSNEIESPVFTRGSAFDSPNKSEPEVGTTPSNRLQPSVNRRQSIICQATHCKFGTLACRHAYALLNLIAFIWRTENMPALCVAGFEGSISLGSQATRPTHPQPCAKLPETDASSVEKTFSTSNKSKTRRVFRELNGMTIMRNNVNAEISSGTVDCPSFDLGI